MKNRITRGLRRGDRIPSLDPGDDPSGRELFEPGVAKPEQPSKLNGGEYGRNAVRSRA